MEKIYGKAPIVLRTEASASFSQVFAIVCMSQSPQIDKSYTQTRGPCRPTISVFPPWNALGNC